MWARKQGSWCSLSLAFPKGPLLQGPCSGPLSETSSAYV